MILSGRRPGGGASSTICLVKAPQCHTYVGSLIVGPSRLSSCLSSVLAINVHTHRHPPSALDTRPPVQTKAAARTYIACCPNGKKQIDGGYHRAKARRGLLSSPSCPRPPPPPSLSTRLGSSSRFTQICQVQSVSCTSSRHVCWSWPPLPVRLPSVHLKVRRFDRRQTRYQPNEAKSDTGKASTHQHPPPRCRNPT